MLVTVFSSEDLAVGYSPLGNTLLNTSLRRREGEGKRSKEKMMALKAAGIQHILHFKQRLLLYVMMYADSGNATMTLSLRDGCVI